MLINFQESVIVVPAAVPCRSHFEYGLERLKMGYLRTLEIAAEIRGNNKMQLITLYVKRYLGAAQMNHPLDLNGIKRLK